MTKPAVWVARTGPERSRRGLAQRRHLVDHPKLLTGRWASGALRRAPVLIDEDESVVLVDAQGRDAGFAPKLQAHIEGLKHRAISVLIANDRGELLLQRRARGKYHSGGLWTNACCSHPRAKETPADAAKRRLHEEMGFAADLSALFVVEYRAEVGSLIENEYVHVFGGFYAGNVLPDPAEVEGHRWITLSDLEADMAANPASYTAWFLHYMRAWREEIAAFAESARRRAI